MSCGLILALSDDPLSRMVLAITKQEYSTLGYYYSCGSETLIHLTDLFGFPLSSAKTLDQLRKCPFIRRLDLRPLSKENEKAFRLALLKINKEPLRESREVLYTLFGLPGNSRRGSEREGQSALTLWEEILGKMGLTLVSQSVNTLYGSGYESCILPPSGQRNLPARIALLAYLASFLNQQNFPQVITDGRQAPSQIQNYILDETVFQPLQTLACSNYSSQSKELEEIYQRQLPRIFEYSSAFLQMLAEPGFLFTVAKGAGNFSLNCYKESLEESFALLEEVFSSSNQWAKKKKAFRELRERTSFLLEVSAKKEGPEISEEDSEKSLESFRLLLEKSIRQQSHVDLHKLIVIYNSLVPSDNQRLELPERAFSGTYSYTPREVAVLLANGDRLNLSLDNPQLSRLDYRTLLDILQTLEKLGPSRDYDKLRTRVAEEIASHSSYMA